MALDRYHNSHGLALVRRRFYEAAEVEALLTEYDRRIAVLRSENERLQQALKKKDSHKEASRDEVADAVFTTQEVCRQIIDRANLQAAEILAEAERTAQDIRSQDQQRNDYALELVESCLRTVQQQQEAALETVRETWQRYLCSLYPEDTAAPAAKHLSPEPAVPEVPLPPEAEALPREPEVPRDLSEKVSAIARELEALEE